MSNTAQRWVIRSKGKAGNKPDIRYVSKITKTRFRYSHYVTDAIEFSSYKDASDAMTLDLKYSHYLPAQLT